jgi:hypothetical protein
MLGRFDGICIAPAYPAGDELAPTEAYFPNFDRGFGDSFAEQKMIADRKQSRRAPITTGKRWSDCRNSAKAASWVHARADQRVHLPSILFVDLTRVTETGQSVVDRSNILIT